MTSSIGLINGNYRLNIDKYTESSCEILTGSLLKLFYFAILTADEPKCRCIVIESARINPKKYLIGNCLIKIFFLTWLVRILGFIETESTFGL